MQTIPVILTIITLPIMSYCMDISCPGAPKTPRSIRFTSRHCPILHHVRFIQAMEDHDDEAALTILEDTGIDPSFDENLAIRVASENGLVKVVARLLDDPRVDPSACNNYAIRNAGKLIHYNGAIRSRGSPFSKGFGPRTAILRLLMADPRVPFPSHLRKPSLNNAPSLPLQLQINKLSLETMKMNDLEQYRSNLVDTEGSHFYFQNLDFACLMAYRHGYDDLFMFTLLKIFSLDAHDLVARGYPRLIRLKQWLDRIFLFTSQVVFLDDIRCEIVKKFVYCSIKFAGRARLEAS